MKYDFSGWATKNNLKCSDGRTILKNAFADQDGKKVPLVWNHQHSAVDNVLGHAVLENRPEGVYAYCTLNDTPAGRSAKELIKNKDISALSIYANRLKQNGGDVTHGVIREVSLVLAGANPGAFIDNVMCHGENGEEVDEAVIYTGLTLEHACGSKPSEEAKPKKEKKEGKTLEHENDKTVGDIFNTLTEEQKTVVYAMIGEALESAGVQHSEEQENVNEDGGDETMKHNVFDGNGTEERTDVLTHDEMTAIISDAKRYGSLKESCLQHGITSIDMLFPDHKNLNNEPDFISRPMDWVAKVMGMVGKSPFSRVKTIHADITADEARALGYIKGKRKKEEVFTLLKRTTDPQTVYKKQKLDRDDVIDITDFDIVAFMKKEMRVMLDEEIARALLIGDGRQSDSDDKIKEDKIRPVLTDDDLYCIKAELTVENSATDADKAKNFIRTAIKARKDYRGSGEPVLFTTEDVLTDCLLLEDLNGRVIYDTVTKLATALRVREIITVPVMEGCKRQDRSAKHHDVYGIIVNLKDYKLGADKGGAINLFDDFDIDYNQQKYLIETRCSGALTKPYSAIVVESKPIEG